jgi:hypothetical protein
MLPDVPVAQALPLEDPYVETVRTLAHKAYRGEELTIPEAELVLLAIAPLCDEVLQRRRIMRSFGRALQEPGNVVYLADRQEGGAS